MGSPPGANHKALRYRFLYVTARHDLPKVSADEACGSPLPYRLASPSEAVSDGMTKDRD